VDDHRAGIHLGGRAADVGDHCKGEEEIQTHCEDAGAVVIVLLDPCYICARSDGRMGPNSTHNSAPRQKPGKQENLRLE
jgi:hypothetical protein